MSAALLRILSGLQGDADAANAQATQQHAELQRLYFDPSNPYSQKNLLDKAFRETKLGSLTNMAAAGQLFAGSYQEQQGIDQSNALTRENAMNEDYRAKSSQVDQQLGEYLRGLRSQGDNAQYAEGDSDASLANARDLPGGGAPNVGGVPAQQVLGNGMTAAQFAAAWQANERKKEASLRKKKR
jgi:hypothetical protein